jgi:diguanylate cyclase (GGDEF)-like protein
VIVDIAMRDNSITLEGRQRVFLHQQTVDIGKISRMDPLTVVLVAAILALLNGGVLGLVHRGLLPDVRPSAADWRIGTLLFAGGLILMPVQSELPPAFILPVYNGCLLLGVALYWRAIRRFYGLPDSWWVFLPFVLATALVLWFAAVTPNLPVRIVVVTLGSMIPLVATAWTLRTQNAYGLTTSRFVLAGLVALLGLFVIVRTIYFATLSTPPESVMDKQDWMNLLTPFMLGILPVIGTTAFLLMASERIRWQWERAAATDYLTELPNRRTITGSGVARFNSARRTGSQFAVAIIDIDHFKSINDRFGHDVGDLALKHVAMLLNEACRGPNMLGRQGGEEFVALLDDANPADAHAAGERLRLAIAGKPLSLPSGPLTITASIGVSAINAEDKEFDDLLRRADLALYEAKSAGRNCVVLRGERVSEVL